MIFGRNEVVGSDVAVGLSVVICKLCKNRDQFCIRIIENVIVRSNVIRRVHL